MSYEQLHLIIPNWASQRTARGLKNKNLYEIGLIVLLNNCYHIENSTT